MDPRPFSRKVYSDALSAGSPHGILELGLIKQVWAGYQQHPVTMSALLAPTCHLAPESCAFLLLNSAQTCPFLTTRAALVLL